jgi:hypothetical protein
MQSLAQPDDRFDEAEADVDYGTPWLFREPDAPNPLTILAEEWTTGITKLGEAEFLVGVDRDGKRWSVLVGCVVLKKRLIEGAVEEWSAELNEFVLVEELGRVQPGEVVSMKYLGDVEGAQFSYPNFKVSRKPSRDKLAVLEPASDKLPPSTGDERPPFDSDDGIPY